MLIYKRDSDGSDNGQGVFDGMMGEMQRYEHDLLATAVFLRNDRFPITDAAAETFSVRYGVGMHNSAPHGTKSKPRTWGNLYPEMKGKKISFSGVFDTCLKMLKKLQNEF